MNVPRLAAAWLLLLSAAFVAFVALNASAVYAHGQGGLGDVLVSLLLVVLAGAGLRTARQLWRGDPAGRRPAIVLLAVVAAGGVWLAAQVAFGWLPVAISIGLAVALARQPPPPAA